MSNVSRRNWMASAMMAGAVLAGGADSEAALAEISKLPGGKPTEARKRTLFGIGYETWYGPRFPGGGWNTPEARPVLGHYSSLDPRVIRRHAHWIHDAGFNFILIDWSNNLGGCWTNGVADAIIGSTLRLLEEYTHLQRHPKVALLLGLDNNSIATPDFHAQIQRIEREILDKPQYAALWQNFDGKPLLNIFIGPSPNPPPVYLNPRFTIRFMGAFHEITLNNSGLWSWVDRMAIANGPATPIFPFQDHGLLPWKAGPSWSLISKGNMGYCATAHAGGPGGKLISPPFTVTQRVITFNCAGVDFWVTSGLKFPGGKIPGGQDIFVLRDASTGAVLRRTFPPGAAQYAMRQWDVGNLLGQQVIFEANASPPNGLPQSESLSLNGLAFTRNEQMVASVALGGNEGGGGSWLNWDAHLRCSGATLVQFMDAAFRYEPEVMMIQQWNEFGAPDQYSVEASNDIEPTVVTELDGPYSDGWGYYYLDLVTKLIRQYRQGFRVPQVMLDTRYP